jgi:hypothetical protein
MKNMKLYYMDESGSKLFDFKTIQDILQINKSKLFRMIKRNREIEVLRYKNQFLYSERILDQLKLMNNLLKKDE